MTDNRVEQARESATIILAHTDADTNDATYAAHRILESLSTPPQATEEDVERVAKACANDSAARSIADKGGTVEFDDMEPETQDFWRYIARAAITAYRKGG